MPGSKSQFRMGSTICSRYKCPRHKCKLVDATIWNSRGRRTDFFLCPVPDCGFCKPNKWQLKPRRVQ